MRMNKNSQKNVFAASLVVGAAGLMLLSGCEWLSSKKDAVSPVAVVDKGDVLLTIDGKPALTVVEYEEQLEAARQGNQEIDMVLQMMPNAEKEYIYKVFETGQIMKAWAEKEGVHETEEFKKERKQLHDAMDFQLYMKSFYNKNPMHISDSDVKAFYDEKKDSIPGLKLADGGVDIAYVRFDSKAKADEFLEKVKDIKDASKFKSLAEAGNLTVADATVNDKSSLSDSLKKSVLAMKHFPKAEVVKVGNNSYWALFASGKTDAKYHDLKSPQVQQGLKKMIADERRPKQLEDFVEQKKKEYNVVGNDDYFAKKEAQKRAAMESMMKQHGGDEKQEEGHDIEDVAVSSEKL